jgi:Protein of unknown function (DUF3489)
MRLHEHSADQDASLVCGADHGALVSLDGEWFRASATRGLPESFSAIEALPDPEPQPDAKRSSKQDEVVAMLRRPEGATVDEVAKATGWQRHTVRGVFSGTLKKKLGLTIASAKEERGRVYRIDGWAIV